ncbi:MAG TPA: DUF389 domain-containing protein [Actinomycetota bacterium]
MSLTYLVIMAIAGFVASIGVYDDQPVLIVGAMALSPDLTPLSALSAGLVARRLQIAGRGAATLLIGLGVAAAVGAITIAVAEEVGHDPFGGGFGRGVLHDVHHEPRRGRGRRGIGRRCRRDVVVRAPERRRGGGVAISVTTIPAAAGLGVAIGLMDLDRALGALAVLAVNLSCLTAGAVVTAALQRRLGRDVPGPRRLSSRRPRPSDPSRSRSPSGS